MELGNSEKSGKIVAMGTLRITEAELARDMHAILAKVQRGVEVVVEQDHRPVAVLRPPDRSGRLARCRRQKRNWNCLTC